DCPAGISTGTSGSPTGALVTGFVAWKRGVAVTGVAGAMPARLAGGGARVISRMQGGGVWAAREGGEAGGGGGGGRAEGVRAGSGRRRRCRRARRGDPPAGHPLRPRDRRGEGWWQSKVGSRGRGGSRRGWRGRYRSCP